MAPLTLAQRVEQADLGPGVVTCVDDAKRARPDVASTLDQPKAPGVPEATALAPVLLGCMSKAQIGEVMSVGLGTITRDCTVKVTADLDDAGLAGLLASEPLPTTRAEVEGCLRENLRTNEKPPPSSTAGITP